MEFQEAMRIAVLNPNSSTAVTASMERSLTDLGDARTRCIECHTLEEAPIGIESDADVAFVTPMVVDYVRRVQADAFVIACFSDPGVEAARAFSNAPVYGIGEAAYCAAIMHGSRFGVISLGDSSVERHRQAIDALGLGAHLAGDRPVHMSVAEAECIEASGDRVIATGRALVEDGADVLILGCGGMGEHRRPLQSALGCAVIDPVLAAVSAALDAVALGYGMRVQHA